MPNPNIFKEGLAVVCFEAALHGEPSVLSNVVIAQDLLEGACHIFDAERCSEPDTRHQKLLIDEDYYKALSKRH